MRRVGIVALARRLAIALWRYLQHGEIPAGAMLKASHRLRPDQPRHDTRLDTDRIIMIKGRRAGSDCGSPVSDRPQRLGASVDGVCPGALRASSIGCRIDRSGADRRSYEHWLQRCSHSDLGARSAIARSRPTARAPRAMPAFVRGP